MKVIPTEIPDVLILEPKVFGDGRGFFFESFQRRTFKEATGLTPEFVQDNHALSGRGVLRGLHYQVGPEAQAKLIRVTHGEVFDVVVDVREDSATLGRWVGVRLCAKEHRQLWIPQGFAHGFLTLSDYAEVQYKATGYYDPENERAIYYADAEIGIEWPLEGDPVLSERDASAPRFIDVESFTASRVVEG